MTSKKTRKNGLTKIKYFSECYEHFSCGKEWNILYNVIIIMLYYGTTFNYNIQ